MANWKKILLSGSNTHVAGITASNLPSVEDNATLLFAGSNGEIQTNSNITFNSTDTSIEFNGGTFSGSFSGSFSGDGSGLTGVGGTADNALVDGNGIVNFSYDGGTSGITVAIDLDTDSGLLVDGNGLDINPTLAGNGLAYNAGVLSVNLGTNAGLDIVSDQVTIDVTDFIDGITLTETSNVIEVDTTYIATSSNTITLQSGSTNIEITANNTNTDTGTGFSTELGDNPSFTIDLADTLTGNFTFSNNVTVQGDLNVIGDASQVNFQTTNVNISDPFVLVGSGSSGDGGIMVETTANKAAFLFYDSDNEAWGVSGPDENQSSTNFTLSTTDSSIATIVTCQLTSSGKESDLTGDGPIFGSSGNARFGHLRISTNPLAKESSLYIFA